MKYNNLDYKTRVVELSEIGEVLISVASLNDCLLEDGKYVSDEARDIDEQIFYFVNDEDIDLPLNELTNILTTEIL